MKCAAGGSLRIQDAKKSPKIAIWAPSQNFDGQSQKKLVKQQYHFHMSLQYGELQPSSG